MTRTVDDVFDSIRTAIHRRVDRMFIWLFLAQWVFAIVLAVEISPYAWTGAHRELHFHVRAAIGFGACLVVLPCAFAILRPGTRLTRHTFAVAQMLWSALLIMISGGRIEMHFHIFGSLAFLSFYRDWRVIATATLAVLADHVGRGLLWPDSIYGIANPEWWRIAEHMGWVVFEDIVLVVACVTTVRDWRATAVREVRLAAHAEEFAAQLATRTADLEETVDRYRNLIERTAAIPFEWDREARQMIYIAPQVEALLGCPAERFDQRAIAKMITPREYQAMHAFAEAYSAGRHTAKDSIDLAFKSLDGRAVCVRMFVSRASKERVCGVLLDVTSQKQLELELHHAQKLEAVGRLASGVAHELNTPVQFVGDSVQFVREAFGELNSVLDQHRASTAALLAGEPAQARAFGEAAVALEADIDLPYLRAEIPNALDRASDGVGRVATIVGSMKAFAHPDAKEMTSCDLNSAIESTLAISCSEYKYVADIETRFAVLPPVICYPSEINQIVLNLIVNAAHAIGDVVRDSDRRGTITVTTFREGDFAVISVRDTGGGIPDAIRERVYEPFFTTKEVGRGTGQGLAIVRSVIERHHGSVTFESKIGVGTTFTLRIPIEPRPWRRAA